MTAELSDVRISIGRPGLRVALAGDVSAIDVPIVVRRPTLRDAQRARSVLRSGTRDTANFCVALEVEVAIAPNAASARAAVAGIPDELDGGTVRYIGTPGGLVTLIRDIYAAEVADAVILVSLDGSATENRVRQLVLPAFTGAARRVA
ncbi:MULTISPECIES: hypothetical protein [unclassified Gordonia (in: high G+C Gram-positive bacteria)]